MKRALPVLIALIGFAGCDTTPTSIGDPPTQARASLVPDAAYAWLQTFEVDQSGWFDNGGTVNREMSGYSNGGGYGDAIASPHGNWHARLRTPVGCTINCGGPFTQWGGYDSSLVPYITEVDVYLDVVWAATHPDVRFDFTSAINGTTGSHRRDFAFNAGTDPAGLPQFVISASNNTGRANSFPSNPGRDPQTIAVSGWYTFRHTFRDQAGVLAVDLDIVDHAGVVVAHWTLSDPSDVMAVVGGNRYGWFANQEIQDLAIDQSGRIDGDVPPTAPGDPATKEDCMNGGWEAYGFQNQGRCIQFVNTGKDSR